VKAVGRNEWNVYGLLTPIETVTVLPTVAGYPPGTVIPICDELMFSIGAAFVTAVVTDASEAPLNVAARTPQTVA
jgi:hypothetical protein